MSQELLSACGGDLCSALPWLALLSANFSYNALTALDSSLVSASEGRVFAEGQGWALEEEGLPAAWKCSILCFLFPPSPASLISSTLLEPEPQSTPGLQGLPDGEYEWPSGLALLGPPIVLL